MSAVEKLPQTSAAADVQGANAFGRINFVAGQGKKIESKRVDVDGDFAGGLHGIGGEIDVGLCGDAADSSSGWTVPSSLLACMMVIRTVSGRMARRSSSRSICLRDRSTDR